jgi:putative CocE/NonD family hydrolase
LVQDYTPLFEYKEKDAYSFFLKLKTLKNINAKYFQTGKIWKEYQNHTTYDSYWKARNIRPHLKNIKPAVLVVGGWYDAEDLFGTLATYQAIEKQNETNNNRLVMGPWTHGAWASPTWQNYATHSFGSNLNQYYQEEIEAKFFSEYLKSKDKCTLAEATVFDAGTNQWNSYDQWPPKNATTERFYFQENGGLAAQSPSESKGTDTYISDPNHPVPYIDGYQGYRRSDYMVADQRFASSRPDVLTYQTEVLQEDLMLTGNIIANLFVSTTGTDADFIVKIIDVLPDTMPNAKPNPKGILMAGFQRLVRAEVLRGKFRERFDLPLPFKPNKITPVRLQLNDVAHTIRKGHRLMIQVQSSWFPLVDLNPQVFMDIPKATEKDFHKATHTIYRSVKNASFVEFQRIK